MAASIELKVTPEVLESTALYIEQRLKSIDKNFEGLEKTIKNSRRYWEGEASDAHNNYYQSYKDEIELVRTRLREDKENLLQICGIYRQNEAEAVNLAASLSSDVII